MPRRLSRCRSEYSPQCMGLSWDAAASPGCAAVHLAAGEVQGGTSGGPSFL
jgi:hypothetical protein